MGRKPKGEALARQDHAAYTRLNYAFHQYLAQTTQNPVLAQSYEAVQQKIWRYRFTINELSDRLAESYAEHESIMIALRARTRLDLAERLIILDRGKIVADGPRTEVLNAVGRGQIRRQPAMEVAS